ncbi:phage tail assembly chaperone [Pseudomonas sp. 22526]|uniref:phage tail assembly chaperone n=1 Tax=Pseudomonas sp. 22526 TaxID=3453937 RepID=UPI003F831A13
MSYQLTANGVYRLADSVFIPEDLANRDWAAYLQWLSYGGEPQAITINTESDGAERVWRDSQLLQTDGLVARHRDELEAGGDTTISTADYESLQAYRRALRSWPESSDFPSVVARPSLNIGLVSALAVSTAGASVRKAEAIERAWRSKMLESTQWLVIRDNEEMDMGEGTTLSTEQFKELLAYRQGLRDWPSAADFPNAEYRPVEPGWLEPVLQEHK